MADLEVFEQYYKLSEVLIRQATKEELAESTRLLALNCAHHQIMHGEIPLGETLAMVDSDSLNEEQLKLLLLAMQNLAGVFGQCHERHWRGKALVLLQPNGNSPLSAATPLSSE